MVKATLVGPRRLLPATLDLLHSLGMVHIDPFPIPAQHRLSGALRVPVEEDESRLQRGELIALRDRISRLRVSLPHDRSGPLPAWLLSADIAAADLTGELARAEKEVIPAADAHREAKEELATLSRYQKVLAALYPLLQEVVEVQHLELLGVILERRRMEVLPLLEKEVSRLTGGRYQVFTREMDRDSTAVLIAYPMETEASIRDLFAQEKIAEIRLPAEYADMPLASTLRRLVRRIKELPALLAGREEALAALAHRWYSTLARMEEMVLDRLDELATLPLSAQGSHTFFLRGWVPRDQSPRLQTAVTERFGGEVLAEMMEVSPLEFPRTPVALRNGRLASLFEPLVGVLALPRYGTLDPTPFMALFFPLFFGFILGDLGYGVILLGAAVLLWRKASANPFLRSLAGVLFLGGISASLFGLAFGEIFGDLGEQLGLHPLVINRAEAFKPILYAAVGLGFVHVALGFVLNLVMCVRHGQVRHACSPLGQLLAMAGVVLAILATAGMIPRAVLGPSGGMLAVALVLLVVGEGLFGVLEALSTFGNVLSYARLMAIGMSSVILAEVANEVGGAAGSLFLGIAIALLFHTLNFALGVFSPTIHSLRLHYVEFFGKFFKAGGRPYQPFRRHEVS